MLNLNMAGMPPLQLDPSALPTMDISSLLGSLDLSSGLDISIEDVLSDLDLSNIDINLGPGGRHATRHRDLATGFTPSSVCRAMIALTLKPASQAFLATPEGVAILAQTDELDQWPRGRLCRSPGGDHATAHRRDPNAVTEADRAELGLHGRHNCSGRWPTT